MTKKNKILKWEKRVCFIERNDNADENPRELDSIYKTLQLR